MQKLFRRKGGHKGSPGGNSRFDSNSNVRGSLPGKKIRSDIAVCIENYDKKSPLKGEINMKASKLPFLESATNFCPKKELNDDLFADGPTNPAF